MAYAKRSTIDHQQGAPVGCEKIDGRQIRAVSDAPTLTGALEQLRSLSQIASSLASRADVIAEKLGRSVPFPPDSDGAEPMGITGALDITINGLSAHMDAISARLSAIDSAID